MQPARAFLPICLARERGSWLTPGDIPLPETPSALCQMRGLLSSLHLSSVADASPKGVNICTKEVTGELRLGESQQRAAKLCARACASTGERWASLSIC